MPLTLAQYATYLDTRDLPWPAPPPIKRKKATPYLPRLSGVRAVTWNVYGTLLSIAGGELYFEHPNQFVMDVALDKTIQEFKMWGSMVRKPGQPTDYLRRVYSDLLNEQRTFPGGGEKYPEIQAERLWEAFIKKLMQKDYSFDAGFYGSLNEFSRKVAYFFHASLQGTACYSGAASALTQLQSKNMVQGLLSDAQSFTAVQLERGLTRQDPAVKLDELIPPDLRVLSYEQRVRKPSDRLFRQMLSVLGQRQIRADEVLHVGSRITSDIVPAHRAGMRAALFAGDKASLEATNEQLKEPTSRPDVLITELEQLADVVG
jgi:FMN phosphatase YigB (HAD superfamily)